jgi:hypothetical protein
VKKNELNLTDRWASSPSMSATIQWLAQLREALVSRPPKPGEQEIADCINSTLDIIESALAVTPVAFGDSLINELSSLQSALNQFNSYGYSPGNVYPYLLAPMRSLFPFLAWKGSVLPALTLASTTTREVGQTGAKLNVQLQAKFSELTSESQRLTTEMESRFASIDAAIAAFESNANERAHELLGQQEETIATFVANTNKAISYARGRSRCLREGNDRDARGRFNNP